MAETDTMKAAMYYSQGKLEDVLKIVEVSQPVIKNPTDVKIKVHSVSLNPIDYKIMETASILMPITFPKAPGCDFSGRIVEKGAEVKYNVGDDVFGCDLSGALCDYIVVSQDSIKPKPDNLSFVEAASVGVVGHTSIIALKTTAQLKQGQKVFINGGSSGTGIIGIQLAKEYGCYVATSCSGPNADFVKSYGADEVVDYRTEDWGEKLKGQNFDAVYDCVGGGYDNGVKILKPSGASYVDIVGTHGDGEKSTIGFLGDVGNMISRKLKGAVSLGPSYNFFFANPTEETWAELLRVFSNGSVKPVLHKTYDFDQVIDAFNELKTRRAKGKIVVTVNEL